MKRETLAIHGGNQYSSFGETSEAMFLTSGYSYSSAEDAAARFAGEQDGFVYSRYANPTNDMFEKRLALLEHGERAFATSSGMAAMFTAIFAPLRAGDHVVASRALFGSCHFIISELLPRYGITTTMVDGRDPKQWEQAVRENTKLFFCESPSNPCLELVDIAHLANLAHSANALLVVDNVFATPSFQKPLELGADVVAYSTTKHIDGQGRCLGGAIVTKTELFEELYEKFVRHTGPAMSPFNAWVMLKGLETLDLRVERAIDTAETLCQILKQQTGIHNVRYPHDPDHPQYALAKSQMRRGGTLISFELEDKKHAFDMLNALKLVRISNNLGDAKSLITHPASTTHAKLPEEEKMLLGITPGTLRLSVGLEHSDDLIEDLMRGMGT